MTSLIVFGAGAVAGYVLAAYTWPALRTFILGVEQELTQVKARVIALETKLRAALGRGQS